MSMPLEQEIKQILCFCFEYLIKQNNCLQKLYQPSKLFCFTMFSSFDQILIKLQQYSNSQSKNANFKQFINNSQPILKSIFILSNISIELTLFNKYLKLKITNPSIAEASYEFFIRLDFSIRFQQIFQKQNDEFSKTIGFSIIRNKNQSIIFKNNNQSMINEWLSNLSKLIYRKGFATDYRSSKYIGRGQFAQVWQIQRIKDNMKFAAKIIDKDTCYGQVNGKQSLQNQIQIMRKLNHPNIIYLECVYESQKRIYIVMNLIEGDSLFNLFKNNSINLKKYQKAKIMKDLLRTIEYMHSEGFAHRDLKPGNIIMESYSFAPYIVDFGLSQMAFKETLLFQYCGSPGYIAPEILQQDLQVEDIRICDIFSLGAIFYLLLTGKLLFESNNVQQIWNENKDYEKIIEKKLKQDLTVSEALLLSQMLKCDPKERISINSALEHNFFTQIACQAFQQQYRKPFSTLSPGKYSIKGKNISSKFQQLFSESMIIIQNTLHPNIDSVNDQNKQNLKNEVKVRFRAKRYFSEQKIDVNAEEVPDDAIPSDVTLSWIWKQFIPFEFLLKPGFWPQRNIIESK